jgi:protein ImuB
VLACLIRKSGDAGAVEAVARACSPRVARVGEDAVLFDASGLGGILGSPEEIAREVVRMADTHGLVVDLALAGSMTAAWLLARSTPGVTVAVPGSPAAVAKLPLRWLVTLPDLMVSGRHVASRMPDVEAHVQTFLRWGLRTMADVARLPRGDLHARMGAAGVRLHQAANGEDAEPFVPVAEGRRFIERQELEWPIEGLEPLSFVLARVCDLLSASLERADRGAIVVITRLTLVTRARHERTLHLPGPMRDAKVLRTLILLDLESHSPDAGIDVVEVEVEVAPGRIAQASLFEATVPSPELLATLVARLGALMGESRVGAPSLVDSHDSRVVGQRAFAPTNRAEGRGQRWENMTCWTANSPLPSALCPLPFVVCVFPWRRA